MSTFGTSRGTEVLYRFVSTLDEITLEDTFVEMIDSDDLDEDDLTAFFTEFPSLMSQPLYDYLLSRIQE